MPWNDNAGGGPGNRGPWGGGPRQPWGQNPRPPQGGGGGQGGPDLDDLMRQFRERFGGGFGGGRGTGGGDGRRRINPSTIALALLVGWVATGIFMVSEGERGVVTRFGAFQDVRNPGLHWHLPFPIEGARVISIQSQRTIDIGVGEDQASENESLMITGDRNIVDIDFRVVYRLSNPRDYLFNIGEPQEAVRGLAESAMREVVGQRELQEVITTDRALVEDSVKTQLQNTLNNYNAGVDVVQVQLLKAAPPADVVDAFNEVVRAGQSAETSINQATQYANEVVPRARGEAAQITQAGEAYREQAVREANGEAARFAAVERQYRSAPAVTRQRLYLEAMERIYQNADTIIVDRNAGAVPILPLDQMRRPRSSSPPAAAPAPQAAPQAPGAR